MDIREIIKGKFNNLYNNEILTTAIENNIYDFIKDYSDNNDIIKLIDFIASSLPGIG